MSATLAPMIHGKGTALLLVALLLVAGACGGDDDSSQADDAADQSADRTADDDDGSGDGSSPPAVASGLEDFCQTAVAARDEVTDLEASLAADFSNAPQAYASAHEALSDIDPPDEIAADWATMTELIGDIADALANVDGGDGTAILATFDTPEMQARSAAAEEASNRIDDYISEQCGVDLTDPDDG